MYSDTITGSSIVRLSDSKIRLAVFIVRIGGSGEY